MKILVVEDSRFQRNQTLKLLKSAKIEVSFAENGALALEKVKEFKPDAIFSDLLMPDMDGIEFLEKFRATDTNTPIFIISANIQTSVAERCKDLGASGFFNKPLTEKNFQHTILPALKELGLSA